MNWPPLLVITLCAPLFASCIAPAPDDAGGASDATTADTTAGDPGPAPDAAGVDAFSGDSRRPDQGPPDRPAADAGDCSAKADPLVLEPQVLIRLVEGANIVHGHYAPPLYASALTRPSQPSYQVIAQEGECTIYAPDAQGYCTPPCSGWCTPEEECQEIASSTSAGDIEVSGLGQPLTFTFSGYGYTANTTLGDELFAPGDCLEVFAEGQQVEAFTLRLAAPTHITTAVTQLTLVDGQDYQLTWTPAGAFRVQLKIEVGQHATAGTLLICEGEDDGAFTIPQSLISQFPSYQPGPTPISGSAVLSSFSRTSADLATGKAVFEAHSQQVLEFRH